MTVNSTHSDIFAGAGVISFVSIHLSQLNEVVQLVAGILTALAAAISIAARFRKNRTSWWMR